MLDETAETGRPTFAIAHGRRSVDGWLEANETTGGRERGTTVIQACQACGRKNRIAVANLGKVRCGACKTMLPPIAEPIDADPDLFDQVVRSSPLPVLVDFWAEWCGPCRMAAPEVKKVAANLAGRALVLKVDTESHPDLAARYNVRGIPNFVVLRGGRVVSQHAGLAPAHEMQRWLAGAAQ